MSTEKKTANYRVVPEGNGNRYEFFCDLSYALVCTSDPVKADNAEEELLRAWNECGNGNFNRCKKCGRWVIDAMYNPDVLSCVKCAPIEDHPDYCPVCGAKTSDPSNYCHICGAKLFLREDINDEKTE